MSEMTAYSVSLCDVYVCHTNLTLFLVPVNAFHYFQAFPPILVLIERGKTVRSNEAEFLLWLLLKRFEAFHIHLAFCLLQPLHKSLLSLSHFIHSSQSMLARIAPVALEGHGYSRRM